MILRRTVRLLKLFYIDYSGVSDMVPFKEVIALQTGNLSGVYPPLCVF